MAKGAYADAEEMCVPGWCDAGSSNFNPMECDLMGTCRAPQPTATSLKTYTLSFAIEAFSAGEVISPPCPSPSGDQRGAEGRRGRGGEGVGWGGSAIRCYRSIEESPL